MAIFGLGKKEMEKNETAVKTTGQVKVAVVTGQNFSQTVLKRPVVTEKAIGLESNGQYVFKVSPQAAKTQIKKEIEKLFGVKVIKVNIVNVKAKTTTSRGQTGFRSGFKKALVKLQAGQKIEIISH